ncbi:hypothetical protein [Mucilaginibacter sp.]
MKQNLYSKVLAVVLLSSHLLTFPKAVLAQELLANGKKELKILDLVAALPEVKEQASKTKNMSHSKKQISLIVSAPPTYGIPFYQVNVNASAPTYDILYQFEVDPKTYQIFYYNATENKHYSLSEWRSHKKK